MSGQTIAELMETLPQQGRVEWIGIRPERRAPVESVDKIRVESPFGIVGDRYSGRSGKRAVTLVQAEHIDVIASVLNTTVTPEQLRRNLVIRGLNLLALKGRRFTIGTATLEFTGLCHPCSFMEETFGPGGYNAVRGHGGITAAVVDNGIVKTANAIAVTPND